MTSELRVDNLKGSTTGGSINVLGEGTSATTNLQNGLAKVWGLYDQIDDVTDFSFATSSITDTDTGRFTVAFTNAFSIRPIISGLNTRRSFYNLGSGSDAITTIDVDLATDEDDNTARDRGENCFVAHGDLA